MIYTVSNSYLEMRISERGQITIPKPLRDRFGMNPDVDVEITPTEHGLLIQYGVLGRSGSTNDYIEEIRGR